MKSTSARFSCHALLFEGAGPSYPGVTRDVIARAAGYTWEEIDAAIIRAMVGGTPPATTRISVTVMPDMEPVPLQRKPDPTPKYKEALDYVAKLRGARRHNLIEVFGV